MAADPYAHRLCVQIGINRNDYLAMKLELGSLQSVKDFADNLKAFTPQRPLNHLICNAAVYRPADPVPAWTDDGYEMSVGVNHLGHFLLCQLLLPELKRAKNARLCVVGSITGNSNTIGGGLVYPRAEIGELQVREASRSFPRALSPSSSLITPAAHRRCLFLACVSLSPRVCVAARAARWWTEATLTAPRRTRTPRRST